MSHHGHDDEMNEFYAKGDRERLRSLETRLSSAVKLIDDIANSRIVDAGCMCDSWLERNGYECESTRRRQRERRVDELDKEIKRLHAERVALK